MPNVEQDYKKLVNVNKVAKAVKDIGRFAFYSKDSENNLLFTNYFILNLTEEQSWEMQCKLLAKKRGVWQFMSKEGLVEEKPVSDENVEMYFNAVKNPCLDIIGRTDLYLENIALYAAEGKYVGIKRHYIEMLAEMPPLKKAIGSDLVIADDVHVLSPIKPIECEYLAPLLF